MSLPRMVHLAEIKTDTVFGIAVNLGHIIACD